MTGPLATDQPRPAPAGQGRAGLFKLLLGFAISAALALIIMSRIDVAQVSAAIGHIGAGTVGGALAALAVAYTAKIIRWRLMLAQVAPDPGLTLSAQTFMAGIALNNLLPFRAGDVARALSFRRALKAPATTIFGLLIVERVLDAVMLLLVLVGVIGIWGVPHAVTTSQLVSTTALAVGGAACMAALGVLALAGRLRRLLTTLVQSASGPLWTHPKVRALTAAIADVLDAISVQMHGRHGLALVALTALAWTFEGTLFAILAAGFAITPAAHSGALSFALATLSTLIPSSPGYVGTFDYAAIQAVQLFGAMPAVAAAFALTAHLMLWVPTTLAGGLALAVLSARSAATRVTRAS